MKYLAVLFCALSIASAFRPHLKPPQCLRTVSFTARINEIEFVMFTDCNPELSGTSKLPTCDDTMPLTESCERDISDLSKLPGNVLKKILVVVIPEATFTVSYVTSNSLNVLYVNNLDPKKPCPSDFDLLRVGESCVAIHNRLP